MSKLPEIGIVTPLNYGILPSRLRDLAVASEQRGLSGIQLGELASTEIFALSAAMLAATTRIRLETAVVSTLTRSPALIAMAAATLAELSGGRFVLGLGAGSQAVAAWHGREFYARPRSAVETAVTDVRRALAGERLAHYGEFRLTGIAPQTELKILISAMNPQMLRAAGRCADGVVVNLCTVDRARDLVEAVGDARVNADVGRPFEFVANVWAQAGGDLETAQRRLRWEIAPYLAVATYRPAAVAIAGEDAVERAAQAWRAGGRTAAAPLVPDELISGLLIHGDADEFTRRLEQYASAGVSGVRLVPLTSLDGGLRAAHELVDVLGELVQRAAPANAAGPR